MTRLRVALGFLTAALAAGLVWLTGFVVLFGPAQSILADPAYQSQKFIDVVMNLPPPPRVTDEPLLLVAAFFLFGSIHTAVFYAIRGALPVGLFQRGVTFGGLVWLLCFPWFEFYLPWNVMHEPLPLVCLELGIWATIMLAEGVVISWLVPEATVVTPERG